MKPELEKLVNEGNLRRTDRDYEVLTRALVNQKEKEAVRYEKN